MGRRAPGVWVRCDECGRQRLQLGEVHVHHCESTGAFSASWRCRHCGRASATEVADARAVERLLAAGVRRRVWSLPAELAERPAPREPFTSDDLLDWALALGASGWLEAQVASFGQS